MTTDQKKLENDLRWVCRSWWRASMVLTKMTIKIATAPTASPGPSCAALAQSLAMAAMPSISSAPMASNPFTLLSDVQKKAPWIRADQAALAAITLAHVEKDSVASENNLAFPRAAQLLGEGDPPLFAEARFKRLIRTDDPAELLAQMVRAVKILGKAAPVGELGRSLLLWGPAVKKRWAFAYWQKNTSAPNHPNKLRRKTQPERFFP